MQRARVLKLSAATAGVVFVMIGATVWLENFLDAPHRGTHWSDAITAVATVVLVLVTSVYVVLTASLARLQERTLAVVQRSDFDKAVRRLMEDLVPLLNALDDLSQPFPLNESVPPSSKSLKLNYAKVDERQASLRLLAMQLPAELMEDALSAAAKVSDAVMNAQAIRIGILKAERAAGKDSPNDVNTAQATWTAVRSYFYDDSLVREGMGLGNDSLPEWKQIADGFYITRARQTVSDLEDKFSGWLRENER
ncbi:MAG: hypothetical protein ACJ74U_07815 [Jatrophihabitantaceae bacterium]